VLTLPDTDELDARPDLDDLVGDFGDLDSLDDDLDVTELTKLRSLNGMPKEGWRAGQRGPKVMLARAPVWPIKLGVLVALLRTSKARGSRKGEQRSTTRERKAVFRRRERRNAG